MRTRSTTISILSAAVILLLAATVSFAAIPSPQIDVNVSIDTVLNQMTWNVTNLTDDSSGFKLVRLDWLYPIYDVSNVAPSVPWTFAKYQVAADDWNGNVATNAVTWATGVANGMGFGDTLSFTIQSIPDVVEQQPYPVHLVWQRLRADTPQGEPNSIDIGIVPEPGSMLTLFAGVSGLGGLLWRRRRRSA